jgi:hypothetical protein
MLLKIEIDDISSFTEIVIPCSVPATISSNTIPALANEKVL